MRTLVLDAVALHASGINSPPSEGCPQGGVVIQCHCPDKTIPAFQATPPPEGNEDPQGGVVSSTPSKTPAHKPLALIFL